jgi:hypothetical protein
MDELAPGLHRWTARHPEWHPGAFGAEVASFALETPEGDLLLVDPLLADDEPGLLDDLAAAATGNTYIFITIGYHARSAEALSKRYDNAPILGPKSVTSRLRDTTTFTTLAPGDAAPAGVRASAIGRPRRSETPLHFPSHDALAFGDALITTPEGELRMWCQDPDTPERRAFYRDRFAPTLAPLVDLEPKLILTTHGAPITTNAAETLERALAAPPWLHRG